MDILLQKAKELSAIGHGVAVVSYIPLSKVFPVLKQVNPKDWDYFVTMSCIQMGLICLDFMNISDKDKHQLLTIIAKSAATIYPEAEETYENCRRFIAITSNGETLNDTSLGRYLGIWIVYKLFGKAIHGDEAIKLASSIGKIIVDEFKFYWE